MTSDNQCWCGSKRVNESKNSHYDVCPECGTAILKPAFRDPSTDKVENETEDLYGENYWDSHQLKMGLPTLQTRAREDLAQRCQYWLSTVLKYMKPEGKALEIGCSHGGFVKLLSLAGFESYGMEMSPAIVKQSAERYQINMLQGPIEQTSNLTKYKLIALFDVMEHLSNPAKTMQAIGEHLDDDGIVAIQTPRHQQNCNHDWPMYLPPEHIYLFSEQSIRRLLGQIGLTEVIFEPALFGYDMFLFASRKKLVARQEQDIVNDMTRTPEARLGLCMIDMYKMIQNIPNLDIAKVYGTKKIVKALFRSLMTSFRRKLGHA